MKTLFTLVALTMTTISGGAAEDVALLPDAPDALAALNASPRHGEWIDIEGPNLKASLRTWIVYPERSDKAPVVVLIHGIYGLSDWTRAAADNLAAAGFIALAPDLISGKAPGGGGYFVRNTNYWLAYGLIFEDFSWQSKIKTFDNTHRK